MSTLLVSTATDDDIDTYTCGMCHVLAIALHRQHGWAIRVALDEAEPFWEDPEDGDNILPAVVHAWAIDPQGQAWDIRGARPFDATVTEAHEHWQPGCLSMDDCRSEIELRPYIGCWAEDGEPIDRPLGEFTDEEVAEAYAVAQASLGHLPGWPQPVQRIRSRP